MGCCISRPTGPNSPYPGITAGSASARAINEPPHAQAADHTLEPLPSPALGPRRARAHDHDHDHDHHHGQPLAQHINKPLRRHVWAGRRSPPWSALALDRERTDFFDTRVAGRPEVWQTLRAALEVLWVADRALSIRVQQQQQQQQQQPPPQQQQQQTPQEEALVLDVEDPAVALATAQSILSAADVTLPTGDLAQGAYDALGNYYALPEHVVSDPTNLVGLLTPGPDSPREETKADLTDGEDATDDVDACPAADAVRKREAKGKAVVVGRDQITVRARLSEGSQDVTVTVATEETVRTIARHVAREARLSGHKQVRIAYMGKILKEGSPLPAQGWKHGHMLNALVLSR
ncbi:hypothetical protein P8C59_006764 [Phyllachora maydis]|uniref:Ubiquitin-like domain-containing protein n=1 Tax=Phyllachora maydis TaxID=1825666 RepID=A0AAD9MDJ4_9PEZI|nr:hypothetical protein P8C59_006764 [Phyllachora maydis]